MSVWFRNQTHWQNKFICSAIITLTLIGNFYFGLYWSNIKLNYIKLLSYERKFISYLSAKRAGQVFDITNPTQVWVTLGHRFPDLSAQSQVEVLLYSQNQRSNCYDFRRKLYLDTGHWREWKDDFRMFYNRFDCWCV